MIARLKKKLVLVLMSALTVMMAIMLLIVSSLTTRSIRLQSLNIMKEFVERDGDPSPGTFPEDSKMVKALDRRPPFGRPETRPDFAYADSVFSVLLDHDDDILDVVYSSQALVDDEELNAMLSKALAGRDKESSLSGWKCLVERKPYGKIVVFMSTYQESVFIRNMRLSLTAAGVFALIPFFIISMLLAKWLIRPVDDAFSKQKQFISDSSHELKTPLTVIGANADVLESEIGENKWLKVIKWEIIRMNELVNDLLLLAKTENAGISFHIVSFNLSKAVMHTALAFESVAFEAQKAYELDIEDGIVYAGDESALKKLVSILIDNALKNTADKGLIRVTLSRNAEKIQLSVYNTGEGIPPEEQTRIFERFYRMDPSRTRGSGDSLSGSFGLGLSIARAVVEQHKGKISVESKTGEYVKFLVTL